MPHNHGLAPWSGNFYSSAHSLPPEPIAVKNSTVDAQMGTWGIVLKPTLRYKVVFDRPFHLKQAVLDSNSFIKQDFHFRVVLVDNNYDPSPLTLCILDKQTLNAILDLEFEEGDDVTFYVKTDLYNMDLNSFSVSLSGKSIRSDETTKNRSRTFLPCDSMELNQKNVSCSLPDERYHKKKNYLSSRMTENLPTEESPSLSDGSLKSPSARLLRAESTHEGRTHPKNSESTKSAKRSHSYKGSFKGDVLGKLGKYLSKS